MKKPLRNKKQIKRVPGKQRGLRYPVEFVAAELGIDCETLRRRCEEASFLVNGSGLKFREAYDALSLKSASESARRRRNLAEAEASEIDTLNKKGLFVYRTDHANAVKDLSIQTRTTIERAHYIPKDSRSRLIKELAEIKPSIAEASKK